MVARQGCAIETARKSVAKILNAASGRDLLYSLAEQKVPIPPSMRPYTILVAATSLPSPIEHHATLHTVENLYHRGEAALSYVKLLPNGHIDLEDLEQLLAGCDDKCLVTLMHANNEIGNILDIHAVGRDSQEIWRRVPFRYRSDRRPLPLRSAAIYPCTFHYRRRTQIPWPQRRGYLIRQ